MDIMLNIFYFLVLIGIVVFIHEGGHYLGALICKIKVLEFSIGFGKTLLRKEIGKDKTIFMIKALPLGGYVKPLDGKSMNEEEWFKIPEKDRVRALSEVNKWKRIFMVFAGPLANFLLAITVFTIANCTIGTKELPPIISEISEKSVAKKSGLEAGDTITYINQKQVKTYSEAYGDIANAVISGDEIEVVTSDNKKHTIDFSQIKLQELNEDITKLTGVYFKGPTGEIRVAKVNEGAGKDSGLLTGDIILSIDGDNSKDMSKFLRIIKRNPDKQLEMEIERNGEQKNISITPKPTKEAGNIVGKINVEFKTPIPENTVIVKMSFKESLYAAIDKTYVSTKLTVVSLYKMLTGEMSVKNISGPLSIAEYSGKSAEKGLYTYLMLIGAISVAVGVFNLLPIPILDGGHIVIYLLEIVKNSDFTVKQLNKIQFIGILIMIGIFTLAMANDLSKYLG